MRCARNCITKKKRLPPLKTGEAAKAMQIESRRDLSSRCKPRPKKESDTFESCYFDLALACSSNICAQNRHKECATSRLGGMLPKTSSSISIWDVAGAEIAHLEERTAVGLDDNQEGG
jgi:hypothetical protein